MEAGFGKGKTLQLQETEFAFNRRGGGGGGSCSEVAEQFSHSCALEKNVLRILIQVNSNYRNHVCSDD